MAFVRFIFGRLLATIPLLIGISIATFLIITAVPGDFVDGWLGRTMAQTGQSREALLPQAQMMRERLGLDQPLYTQYFVWIKNIVLSGDFGMSFTQNRPVTDVIELRLWRTIGIALVTLVVGQVIGVFLGIYAATNQYKWGDTVATLIAFLGIVIPKFVVESICSSKPRTNGLVI